MLQDPRSLSLPFQWVPILPQLLDLWNHKEKSSLYPRDPCGNVVLEHRDTSSNHCWYFTSSKSQQRTTSSRYHDAPLTHYSRSSNSNSSKQSSIQILFDSASYGRTCPFTTDTNLKVTSFSSLAIGDGTRKPWALSPSIFGRDILACSWALDRVSFFLWFPALYLTIGW